MSRSKEYLKLFLHLSRPLFLTGGFLLYGLGTAIATYLGKPIDWSLYILGQLLVTSIQLMAQAMVAFFDGTSNLEVTFQSLFSGDRKALDPEHLPYTAALISTIVTLTISATLAALLLIVKNVSFVPWAFMLMGFFAAFFYSTPPVRLITSGFGEIIASIVVASFVPIFSFTLQAGELHRLLPMSTIPLAALLFAAFIASEFADYASDLKRDRKTLMVRLGWETAMKLHDLAILFAILSFITAYILGLPDRVALGALISFPLAIAQVWQLNRIKAGFPPRWRTFTLSALALFAMTTYLELMGYIFS
ncbi:MAG: prenyltransferase [Anaerolineales bacterium]|jgi:1,4-dihydroxy-2-naphthoate octaprenyltransferase|nr:MAG: prenyltransferase [Anaerolineales bacterium]